MSQDLHRQIAHFDLDCFFVAVERLKNSRLIGKPVIVGGMGGRGVVAAASYEARKFGIHSALPMKIARRLCPGAIILEGDYEEYVKRSAEVTDIIRDTVPLFEKASIDEFYIDLTGMDKFFGCSHFSAGLKQRLKKESGLTLSYGLAINKLISKIAANEIKPDGGKEVRPGHEQPFLDPLSIIKMPGIGKETAMDLLKRGISTIRELREIPEEMMTAKFGKNGLELSRRSMGIDDSPVRPYREQRSISTETTFQQDTIDIAFLHSQLVRMVERIAFELREQNKLTGCVSVKIRYSNMDTASRQKSIEYTNGDHQLFKTARELFEKLYERRMLVRLIGVRFTSLVPGTHQMHLFEDTQETIRLYEAIDSVKHRFGEGLVVRASGLRS